MFRRALLALSFSVGCAVYTPERSGEIPAMDSDQDNIADAQDTCPNDPEDYDAVQDEDGCPDLDHDPQTILDLPEDAPAASAAPCDLTSPALYNLCKQERYLIEGVFFHSGKDSLMLPESATTLEQLAKALLAQPVFKARIEVHTDAAGADAYNLTLSQKRADAVSAYLQKLGVPGAQLSAVGFGETKPIGDNNTAAGRALNRRIELVRF